MEPIEIGQEKNPGKYLWRWRDLLIILVGTGFFLIGGVLLFMVIFTAMGNKPQDLLAPTVSQTLGLTALEALALVGGVYFFGLRRRGLTWDAVGLRSTTGIWYVISVVVTLMVIPIISLVTLLRLILVILILSNLPRVWG